MHGHSGVDYAEHDRARPEGRDTNEIAISHLASPESSSVSGNMPLGNLLTPRSGGGSPRRPDFEPAADRPPSDPNQAPRGPRLTTRGGSARRPCRRPPIRP